MDAGPGTDLGAFGWFMGVWVTMMAAMMLPSAVPAVPMFAGLRRGAPRVGVRRRLPARVGGRGARCLRCVPRAAELVPALTAWDERGPWVAGGALVLAGLYQLTPLKNACLRHCRAPLGFLLRGGPGRAGAVRTGLGHGAYCVGCCAGLMLALFALGVMSLVWMIGVAAVILVEKVLPRGEAFASLAAVGLVAAGVWVALAPGSVPGLTQPGGAGMKPMQMEESP